MEFETFKKMIDLLEEQSELIHKVEDSNIRLLEFMDPMYGVITILMTEIYGKDKEDMIGWFCYENNFGKGHLKVWDEEEKPTCYSLESLYNFLEK
jgi:hypothetical protein